MNDNNDNMMMRYLLHWNQRQCLSPWDISSRHSDDSVCVQHMCTLHKQIHKHINT